MKTSSTPGSVVLAITLLLPALSPAETLAWWRLADEQPPQIACEGGPNLKWWTEPKLPYVSEASAPPASLYRTSVTPPERSFAAGASYLDVVGGLISLTPGEFGDVSAGLTVEGFFKTSRKKAKLEIQTIVTCGDGGMDASWAVRLMDGRLAFAVYQDNDKFPVAQVEAGDDFRDEKWHYFAASVSPSAAGKTGRISLKVTSEDGAPLSEATELPDGVSVRRNSKPLLVGRSSIYIDSKPEYAGTWDTFQGLISDIRISNEVVPDSGLLGAVTR